MPKPTPPCQCDALDPIFVGGQSSSEYPGGGKNLPPYDSRGTIPAPGTPSCRCPCPTQQPVTPQPVVVDTPQPVAPQPVTPRPTGPMRRPTPRPTKKPKSRTIDEWTNAVDATPLLPTDIDPSCYVLDYDVGLYSFANDHGSHFFVGAVLSEAALNNDDQCPATVAFASIDSSKVIFQVHQDLESVTNVWAHPLGKAPLEDILSAEESVSPVNDAEYDLTRNSW